MSDTGGGSATTPTPAMSDSEGAGGGGGTTSASGLSRTSETSRTSLVAPAATTTISTIAVQSGNTRIVIALLQSAEWLELRVVELTPGMVYLGSNLQEATQLLRAHEEVLTKLQSKQSPVEDLLNQADQLISTQHPRAEVYAAMAESLGLAWKNLNSQLETRKQLLDMGVAFHTRAQQYSDSMDAAERAYTDNVMPNDAEGARQLLSALHDHKRAVLEASMYTLQEAQALLARLRGLSSEGATLDSRPLQIKTNIEFACSQIEHYLESLHDRRRFLDGLFSARKHHLEQCLALCLLYQDLTEAVTALKQLRDEVSQHQGLGESQSNAEILLHEHTKREMAAKEQQDKCIRLLKIAETMASGGHYAGVEARSRAYSVLEAATALHETCDTRTALLQQSILFFKLAQTALTKLDQAEVQVASLSGEGAQRLSLVLGVVEEAVQPALTEGYAILEVTGGRNQPHNMGISLVVEELERRRSHLSSICVFSTEQILQRTELSNAFLEQYNTIESWLVRIGDAFLQGHQDPGGSLSLAKDFLHLHQTLSHDVTEKKNEISALRNVLEKLLPDLSAEEGESYQEKMQALQDHWATLKQLLDLRIVISEKYVRFHEDAEAVNNEHEALELLLKEAKGEDRGAEIEAKWEQVQKQYLDLCNTGKDFCQYIKNAEDPYLDSNRAILCVETILEHLGKRRLVITDLHSHFHMKITVTKEMIILWNTYRENIQKMQSEMSGMERDFCPLLRGDTANPEGLADSLEQRLNVYVSAVKKTQEDIQNMMTRAEVMSYKGDEGGQRDEVIGSLLQLYQNLQNKATEYQILGHMLMQWCRNIAEIHRSCDKLESQFGNVSLDIGGVEGQIREHEASRQAVLELLKFAQNEADSIISKIKDQCPPEAGAQDISVIEELLKRRGEDFEIVWIQHQQKLERQLKRSQYHVDLQVISDQLRDLSEQLSRMRGHYGDSLAAAINMQTAFTQFQITVNMLEKRIQTFVTTTTKMLGPDDDSGEIQEDLAELEKKWSTFQMQVGQSKKSIELSIVFHRLVEEAEDWVKEGSNLLVDVAGESASIQSPGQAEKLRSRIEHFLQPGEQAQQERITKISSLALQLYGNAAPKQIEVVNHQNTQMIDSFTIITRNLTMMVANLRTAEEHREKQKKEKEELAASLAAAQAEAEAARLAATAAEEARKAAEEVAKILAIPIQPIVPKKVEIEIQTEAIPLPEETPKQEDTPPPKKAKLIDDEPQPMPPIFLTPLVGATVTEGVKFSFECKVLGMPMPEVEWLKDNMSITANPDYKTSFEEGVCTLTIEETFTEDSALFTCRAVNGAGMAETSATLTVKEAEPVEVLAPPSFTKRLVDSTAKEGSSFQLEATVEGHPLPVVSWTKDGNCVDESPDYVITFNNGECVLRFEEVFLEDQAEYSCKATNDLGEDITKAKLTVTAIEHSERPKFTMPLSNVMARAGQKFKLECHVTGLPAPTITWFHNSKPVKETLDCRIAFDGCIATLVMSEAFPKNAGTYTVVAKNSAGEGQCSANVSVKGRIPTETSDSEVTSDIDVEPVKPTVQLPLKDTNIKEGKTARLDCVIVGQPEPEVIWYHDDKPVKESNDFKLLFHGDRCSLIIQEAFLEDAGIYRVVAMNSAGEASTACFLNVEPTPELIAPPASEPPTLAPRFSKLLTDNHVTEGNPVTLRATVTGQPKPTVAWFRDGMPLIPDNELQIHESSDGSVSATIHATTLDHTGQYEIVASNTAGTASCVAYLSIEPRLPTPPPVEQTKPPVFTKLISDTTVTSGSDVKFEAEVEGLPTPTVYWTLNDCRITGQEYLRGHLQYVLGSSGNTHILELPTTSMMQAGRVAIIAENSVGRAVSAAALNIVELPIIEAKPVMPVVQQHTREESHVSSSTSSTTVFQKSSVVETSHVTKVVSSDGTPDQKMHSMASTSTSHVKKATGQPTVEVHGARLQEMRQEGGGPPVIADKVSLIKKEGEIITQQINQDSSTIPVSPPAKKIFVSKKKLSPARFITPLQGVIAKEDNQVILECVIDGYPDPSVTWTHNDGPLKDDAEVKTHLNKTTLIIPKVNQSHSGHYTCLIENDAGSAQCTCDVIIKKTQFPPVISKRLQPAVVGVNERLHLEIDVTGTPLPQISWTKDGQPICASDHITLKSEGTRHLLIIQQAETGDSGRYGVIASNPAGRAESLADVMVTQLILDKAPPTHRIIFADITDEAKRNIESVEEGHVKTIKRAIEEVAVETPPSSSPVKVLKASLPKPTYVSPITTEALPTTPSTPQAPPPEPMSEEEVEVRRPPGKLKMMWPPPPSDDQADRIPKIDTSVEITSCNVSSIISSFSASEEMQASHVSQNVLPKQPSKPQLPPKLPEVLDIELQPEPEPEYVYMTHPEQTLVDKPESQYEITPEEQPDTSYMPPSEQALVPEPEYELQIVQSPEPVYMPEPYLESVCLHEPEMAREVKVIEQLKAEGERVKEYKRIPAPVSEPHTILSPVPEVVPEPVSSPEPCTVLVPEPTRIPAPESPTLPAQASRTEQWDQEFTPYGNEPIPKREVRTESSSVETSIYESKKSISKSSYSTVQTKVYTTGISSPPPEQPVKVTTEVTTQTLDSKSVAPDLVLQPTPPAVSEPVIPQPNVMSEPVIPESIVETSASQRADIEPEDLKPSPENGPIEYFVPEREEIIEFMPSPLPVPEKPSLEPDSSISPPEIHKEIISESEKSVSQQPWSPKPEEIQFENMKHTEDGSKKESSHVSSFSSISSKMQTFVSSSDVQTKVFTPVLDRTVTQSKRPQPLIMPESKVNEQASIEETIKPPKPPERDEVKEQKKPKKKRESVIQLARRLEETIVPMSPDEVPGGIRMFPSPKQPSTPVRDVPAPAREISASIEDKLFTDFKTEKFPDLEPFPFTVEERPRRERPRSLPPPLPSKFIPGTFTDSEYESDMEPEQRIRLKKIKFEVPGPAPRPVSVGRDPIPPSVFDTPPVFEGGMRPEILKKEEVVKEKPKVVTPKKKAKIVEKFLASAGASAEQDIVKKAPEKSKQPIASSSAKVAHERMLSTSVQKQVMDNDTETFMPPGKLPKSWPPQPQPQLTHSVKSDSVSVVQQPLQSEDLLKQTATVSSFSETKKQITSVSYQTKETKTMKQLHHTPIPVSVDVPEPTPVLVPEPAPEYVLQPEPAPEYVFQPELVCESDIQPKPMPEYNEEQRPAPVCDVQSEPTHVQTAEPEPVHIFELQPEPAPEYITEPETVSMSVTEPLAESSVVAGFRSVQAPTAKHDQKESSSAPPPPFDMTVPKFTVDSKPTIMSDVKTVSVIKAKVEEEVQKPTFRPVKPEPQSQSVARSLRGGKKAFVWPPNAQDEEYNSVTSLQTRSQSAERPQVSEAIVLPLRPHEAPPAIYWSSNITLQEKRMSWPQAAPQVQTVTSSTVLESSSISSKQETLEMSQKKSQTSVKKQVEIKAPKQDAKLSFKPVSEKYPTIRPKKPIQTPAPPSVQKVQNIQQKKEIIVKTPAPPRESSVVSPIIQLPPLEPFPFKVEPEREKKPRGEAPSMPTKFVPGSFTESEYESDYDSKSSSFSRLYLSDSEATGYRPLNIKMKRGRTKKPKQPSPPPPSTFGAPPFETKLLPLSFHISDIDSDIQTSRESTPVPRPAISQSKQTVHSAKSLVSQITPANKPVTQKTTVLTSAVTSKAATFTPPKPKPDVAPKVVPLTSKPAPSKAPEPTKKPAPLITDKSSAPRVTESTGIQDLHAETVVQITEKQERGVLGMRKIFEGSGPTPRPQGVTAFSRTPGLSYIRGQSPSTVRSGPISPSVRLTSPTGVAPIQAPAPTPTTVPTPPASEMTVRIIPVVPEDGVGKTSSNTKTKPSSPKSKKKIDTPVMSAQELEESGYAADTEGTLPRRSAKTAQSMNSSSFASTSSFSKSETFMSSSFSKTESKSFMSSESGHVEPPSFPSDFGFSASGGQPPESNFPSGSFPFPFTPASSVGQTSQCSSSFKSSESKSSQMFTSRSEEIHEERRGSEGPKTTSSAPPPQKEKKRPKFEEYRRDTQGKPGTSGPFSEDTYYAMKDESDVSTDTTRTQKKVEFKSETHVEVMSDKKVEVFESTSVDVSPQPSRKQVVKVEQKIGRKAVEEPTVQKPQQATKPVKLPEETTKQAVQDITGEKSKTVLRVSEDERAIKRTTVQTKTGKSKTEEKVIKTLHPASEATVKPCKKPEHEKLSREPKVTSQARVPEIEPLKSTGLVKQAVTKHEREKEELDLKPFPFKAEPEKPKKPRGAPPPQPVKFVKGEFIESDYESDYEGQIQPKWKPADSDSEVHSYGQIKAPVGSCKVSQPHVRTPTPPTAFDEPPQFEGPPRPKIEFPESETEPEREISPEIIIPEKVEIISTPKPPTIVPKEPKIFQSQPQKKEPPPKRSPSPVLKPGSPPVEDYAPPQSQPSPFSNAVGVESTKITKIADSSKHHQRFVSMQQTTRVIKFTDARTATTTTDRKQAKTHESRPLQKEEHKQKPLPPLEPFPFSPEPAKPKKDKGTPPTKPKKFHKGEFSESDYESDFEGRIKPKWQPVESDAEDPSYKKVKPTLPVDRTHSKSRERTPTPPTVFDTPPETREPWRPNIEPPEPIPQRERSLEVIISKESPKKREPPKKITVKAPKKLVKPDERPYSPPLPSPGPTPEEGIIVQETQYVVDKVDLRSRVIAPPVREVETYEEKPYKKITERTERTITNLKMEEELKMKKEKMETKKTVVTEYEQVPSWSPPSVESEQQVVETEKFPDLEPFPFEPDKGRPKRDRGPPPPKPKKFVKGEFRESDYDSDYEGKVRPKWKPADSDVEDPEYTPVRPPKITDRHLSKSKERTPTPPTKFEVPPQSGGPLRPTIDPVDKPILIVKETSPEIIIPKVKEQPLAKVAKVIPKAPVLKPKEPAPEMPKIPTPPLPEPGPEPEIGYVQVKVLPSEEKEDAHIRMIKKKTEAKKGFQIDIDITDIYDFVSESDHDRTDTEPSQSKPFPHLEPFPYEPDPSRPKRQRGPPPPQPKKFLKGEFRGSDYESDYETPIAPKWVPPDSESEEHVYRRVAPPTGELGKQQSESLGRDPSPPSKFDQPPHFEGPPRPVMELSDLPRRERRESLEEYSIPRFPKVEFKPFDLEDDVADHPQGTVTTDTETEPELQTKGGIDRKYVKSAQKVVSHQFEDMTQTFRHKAQKFAEQLVTEVFAAREGSVPAEPAGEPPSLPEELRTQSLSPDSTAIPPTTTTTAGHEALSPSIQEPQAYRDESRVSEFGTKHIDPDTGLIYFKYDFGYEFGVVLPGEAKKVEKKKVNGDHSSDIPIPVIHEKTEASKTEKSTAKTNGHVHHLEVTSPKDSPAAVVEESTSRKGTSIQVPGTDHVSPQPSLQSDISETDREYQQYMGKMIPEFVPKKQAQFRPISGDPYSDSEAESDHPSPSKISELSPGIHVGPKRFVPLVPGAAVQPKTLPFQGSPADALYTTTDLGVLGSPLSATPPSTPSTPRSGPLTQPIRPPHYITPLRDLTVIAGESLRLECVVQADPPVQVTWSKGGIILQNGPDHQIVYRNGVCRLIIPQVFPEDEGVFTCTAVNQLGVDSTSATVCITGEKK